LGLSGNRLTAVSIPTILDKVAYNTLLALDLSFNSLHMAGATALASYFRAKTVLQDLDISNCGITCSDVKVLFGVLSSYANHLEELRISSNIIAEEGAAGSFTSDVYRKIVI
jgi:Ran GTPase-activating protein (RanGAP) involved in mRNA processing and transport